MYCRNHQSGRLPNTPIQNFTRSANPKIYRISYPECKKKYSFYIGTVLSLNNIMRVQEEKYKGAERNYLNLILKMNIHSQILQFFY